MTGKVNNSVILLTIVIFIISTISLQSNHFQNALSSPSQQQEIPASSLTVQPLNDSNTIQCITTPCEFPSPQPIPLPNSETGQNSITSIPKKVTQPPEFPQTKPNHPEPCISPCPPGEICIQMCKPIDDVETSVSESSSSNEGQGQQNEPTSNSDESLENTVSTNEIEDSPNFNNKESQDTSEVRESSESTT